jgi:hypothetical protein
MTIERRPRPRTAPGIAQATELKRIPLPALPHFRGHGTATDAPATPTPVRPGGAPAAPAADVETPSVPAAAGASAPTGQVPGREMSELLGPAHEGGMAQLLESFAPQRTGATGATIMNDLVDEIEKGLERELARAPIEAGGYRRVLACAGGSSTPRPAPADAARTERRTEE